jgi:hypothetical protein
MIPIATGCYSSVNVLKYLMDFVLRTVAASAVMTVSQHIEMGLTQRPASDLPVCVTERLIHRSISLGVARILAGQLVQGTLAAAAIALARLTRRCPAVLTLASSVLLLSFGNALVLRALHLADMPWHWSKQELGTDLLHKASLALAAQTSTQGAFTRPNASQSVLATTKEG